MNDYNQGYLERLARWFLFSVIIALLPLAANALRYFTKLMANKPAIDEASQVSGFIDFLGVVCGHGELLLVAAAISAASVGDLVASKSSSHGLSRILVGGGSVLLVALSSLWYPMIVELEGTLDASSVALGSFLVWCSSVITGASSIYISTLKEGWND